MPCLAKKTRPRIARDGHSSNLMWLRSRRLSDVTQRIGRETRAMLDPNETLFFSGGDQSTVGDECSTGIAMICINSENTVHSYTISQYYFQMD